MSSEETQNSTLTAYYMPRHRIEKILDQAVTHSLVYVIAGAGYGKTQAIQHYVNKQHDAEVRWIQLSNSDNIGSRYWESFTHTISIYNIELATKLRELGFPETQVCFNKFAEVLRTIVQRSARIFFVLDDFHMLHSKKALDFAQRCVHMQIPGICVIIISRKEPEINTISLFAKNNVSIITEDELRFSAEEAEAFFRQQAILLSQQNLLQTINQTKGWPLAINLLSLILKKTPNNLKCALDAMTQNIFKFLENEAWSNFSDNLKKGIVKLSLLSDLPATPLQEFSSADIEVEFSQNIYGLTSFIWFNSFTNDLKIHPLYLEFLQSKHHILSHKEMQETYQWAAEWCIKNDFYIDAISYYAKLKQYENMIEMLLSYPLKLSHDTSEYFLKIIESLNTEDGESHTSLLFLRNFFIPLLLVGAGRYQEAKERSLAVIKEWEHMDDPLSIALLHTSYSNLAYIDMYTCTFTHKYDAPEYLKKSLDYFKQSTTTPAKVSAAFINADMRSFACLVGQDADLQEMDEFLEAARQVALYIGQTPYNIYAGYEDLVACEYAYYKNQPDIARTYALNAILKARKHKQHSIEAMAESYLLRLTVLDGNPSLTKEILKQMRSYLENKDFWNRQLYHDLYTGAFYALIGFHEMVPQWLILNEKDTTSDIHVPARELIVSALYFISSKKYQQALTILCNSCPRESYERFLFGEIKLTLLNAIARIKTGDTKEGVICLEKAYQMSFNGMFEMFFVERGKELHQLVVAALKKENCVMPKEWLKTIDYKASIYAKKATVIANALKSESTTIESMSLTNREKEILVDLYHGLSREEIAVNRFLSINTVKKTLQSIYAKLDARNNVDAVRISLEKKLIE